MNERGLAYNEKDIASVPEYKAEFREKGHTKVPQVWIEKELIGGYEALREFLGRTEKVG